MNILVQFYRFLINEEACDISFKYPPWEEKEKIVFVSGKGTNISKKIITTDVSEVRGIERQTNENAAFEGGIVDGGLLRPMNLNEQQCIITALSHLGHIEMTLIFLLGMMTGARKQTILTLRRHQFLSHAKPNKNNEVVLFAGPPTKKHGVIADVKDSNNYRNVEKIYVPFELIKRVSTYLHSERAINRLKKAQQWYSDIDQYVFLNKQGNPLYIAKNDPNKKFYRTLPSGNAITKFVSVSLRPKLRELGFNGTFRFHDLRATYGMNLVNSAKITEESFKSILTFVKERMNHRNIQTTLQYLKFNSSTNLIEKVNKNYESYLTTLFDYLDS